jgi:hypothetical protein
MRLKRHIKILGVAVDLLQPSTQRGIIWGIFGLSGVIFAFLGKDVAALVTVASAMTTAGAHGFFVDDDKDKDNAS